MPTIRKDVQALGDLEDIYDYIGVQNHSPRAADRFMDELNEKFER